MTVKANFSALQQQKESNIDFSKGILNASDIYLKMQENRRQEDKLQIDKDLLQIKKDDILEKAYHGVSSAIDEMFKTTGQQQPDEALHRYFLKQKERSFELIKDNPDWRSNPKIKAELSRLQAGPKYISKVAEQIKSSIDDLEKGLKWSVNSKGEKIPPKYSEASRSSLNKMKSMTTGDFIVEDYNGVPTLFTRDEKGSYAWDLNDFLNHGFKNINLFDYNTWQKEKAKTLGSIKKINDVGDLTITKQKFDDIRPSLEADVINMIGSDANSLTDIGRSILVDWFNYDADNLRNYDDATHKKLINNVVENFRTSYKEEDSSQVNVALKNSNERARHNKVSEATANKNAETSRINAKTNQRKVNYQIKQDEFGRGNYQYASIDLEGEKPKKGITFQLKKGVKVYDKNISKEFEANSLFATGDSNGVIRYYATDGVNAVEVEGSQQDMLNRAGITAKKLQDALNNMPESQKEKPKKIEVEEGILDNA